MSSDKIFNAVVAAVLNQDPGQSKENAEAQSDTKKFVPKLTASENPQNTDGD